jgi:hypothetical protein
MKLVKSKQFEMAQAWTAFRRFPSQKKPAGRDSILPEKH